MNRFVRAIPADELRPGEGRRVEIGDRAIAVFRVDGRYYAIDDTCTHAEASLSEGDVEGGEVICPWHGACFELATGAVKEGPADEDVASYPVRVADGYVEVEI